MRYQDVKQMISQKWQVQSSENSKSLTDKDTIPADLFWVICGSNSESERRLLPVMNEIMRRLQNMGLILIFLFVSWCSIIFFGRTFKISSVVSSAVEVTSEHWGRFPVLVTFCFMIGQATSGSRETVLFSSGTVMESSFVLFNVSMEITLG